MATQIATTKILIIGGGFGGVSCVLALSKYNLANAEIILISDRSHFEYTPFFYQMLAGKPPRTICLPLKKIFAKKNIEFIEDPVVGVDLEKKTVSGHSGSSYDFDFLVLALGSETDYFDVPGLKKYSFGLKSVSDVLRLKRHFGDIRKNSNAHIVIIGGGTTGTELAGELKGVDLIEACSRLLPNLPEDMSNRIEKRLRELGANVFTNRKVIKEELEKIYLKDMEIKTKTVIWAAGVKPHRLYSEIKGFSFDQKGRVLANKFLQAKEHSGIFIIGDAASTPYCGTAQTAIYDGKYVARTILDIIKNRPLTPYKPKKPFYVIPVGRGWAAALIGRFRFYGRIGWWLRKLADKNMIRLIEGGL